VKLQQKAVRMRSTDEVYGSLAFTLALAGLFLLIYDWQ